MSPSNGDPRRYDESASRLTPFGAAEVVLYDALGPKARRLIAETPIDIDVRSVLVAFRNRHAHDLFDPATETTPALSSPKADDLLARFLYAAIQGRVPGWRPIEHRPTARGARSARQGLGGASRRWPTTRRTRPASSP